ncbi:cytochrome P450 [Seiridium cupressi]
MGSTVSFGSLTNLPATDLVLIGSITALTIVCVSTFIQWHRLSHVPGPLIASLTNLWGCWYVYRMQFHQKTKNINDQYGKIVRISPNDVLVSDPDTIWHINSARSLYPRGGWYGSIRFNPYGDSVFSELNTSSHDKRKSKLYFGFSGKGLMDLEGSLDAQLAVLVDVLKQRTAKGKGQAIVDIGRILQYFQVDLITCAGFGESWGDMTSDKDHFDYLATGDKLIPFVHSTAMVPWLRSILFSPIFLRFTGPGTTSGWLSVLREAVESRVKNGASKTGGGDMLLTSSNNKAVINEGMRVMPPVTAGFPKTVPPGGDTLCGKALPEGAEVHMNFTALMRDQEVFGADIDLFRPERFIDCDEATKTRRMKVVDLNFGHGRWQCLGKVLALMEMNKIFVETGMVFVPIKYSPARRRNITKDATMTFQFIDNASIDANTRKLIRSQAAKGKNIGKGRPRRKPRPTDRELQSSVSGSLTGNTNADNTTCRQTLVLEHPRGDALSLYPMPFHLGPSSKNLFRQVFSFIDVKMHPSALKSAIKLDTTQSIWARFAFIDEAYFHCTVALINAAADSTLIGGEDSAESMRHLTRTFRLVNQKLSGNEATADTTFAAVVAMTQYERMRGKHEQGLIHLNGLQRLTGMRGGIRQLARNHPALTQKMFRADLEFALNLGTRTRFQSSDIPSDHIFQLLNSSSWLHLQLCDTALFNRLSQELQNILLIILKLAALINDSVKSPAKINGDTFHDTVILMGYQLIQVNPLSAPPLPDDISNLLHLGLYAFVATFLAGLNKKFPSLPILSDKIKSTVLRSDVVSIPWHETLLWTLFMGRTTIVSQIDDTWVLPRICESIQYLGISNPQELRQTLSKFPWIDVLHDNVCERLYMRISNELRTPPLLGI